MPSGACGLKGYKMEKRKAMIHFNKSGSGSYTPRATIPAKWTKEVGITPEEREAVLSFDGKRIIIEKPSG